MDSGAPSRKRSRSSQSSQQKARWASSRFSKLHPWEFAGAARLRRGSQITMEGFGASYKDADARQRENRRITGWTGRGLYGKAIGSRIGEFAARRAGASARGVQFGSEIGGSIGDYGEAVLRGRGAYEMDTNGLFVGSSQMTAHQSTSGDETGDITISHKEFLQAITPSSSSFQTQYFQAINPGLSEFAPWLAQIAQYYEEYELIQCMFEFKSLVTEGNSTAAGQVIVATQYNPLNSPFVSQQNMENYVHAKSCKMTTSMLHGVECDPHKRGGSAIEYVRTSTVPAGQDAKTYDLGVTQLSTVGASPGLTIGNLYVHYTVRLSKSKVSVRGSNPNPSSILSVGGSSTLTLGGLIGTQNDRRNFLCLRDSVDGYLTETCTDSSYDPTGQVRVFYESNDFTTSIVFPAWVTTSRFLVTLNMNKPADPVSTQWQINYSGFQFNNCSLVGDIDGTEPSIQSVTTADMSSLQIQFLVQCNAPGNVYAAINMTGSFLCPGVCSSNILITQVDPLCVNRVIV